MRHDGRKGNLGGAQPLSALCVPVGAHGGSRSAAGVPGRVMYHTGHQLRAGGGSGRHPGDGFRRGCLRGAGWEERPGRGEGLSGKRAGQRCVGGEAADDCGERGTHEGGEH